MRTVSRVYDNYADAVAVVSDLEAAADLAPNRQISMIANEDAHGRDRTVDNTRTETKSEAGPGAGIGAIVGGVGLLTGLGLLAIQGWVRWSPQAGWQRPWQVQRLAQQRVASSARSSSLVSLMKRPKCTKSRYAEAAPW